MNKIIMAIFCLSCCAAMAQGLSPEDYIKADLEARRVTLAGMEARLALMQGEASMTEQFRLAEETRLEVEAVFASYGITGASHAAYGTQHQEEIAAWLVAHPQWQQQYEKLAARFTEISRQFD